MTIADRIRNRRLELGLSVDDLAQRLQKNRATVYRYESSYIKTYSPDVITALADALHNTPAYFYGYEEPSASLSDVQPLNDDVRVIVQDLNKLTPEQLAQAKNLFRAYFQITNQKGDDDK